MSVRQDKVVIPRRSRLRQFNFVFAVEAGLYWQHLGGGYGSAGMRPERRPGAGMAGVVRAAPAPQPFWRESVKSREREGSALAFRRASFLVALFPQSAVAVLVRQLRGPHLSTCPWCSRRSSMALTAATSARSLPQSSTGRLEVSRVLARS